MISKKLERLQAAFENLTEGELVEQVVVDVIPATVDVIDYVDQSDNQEEMNKAVALQTLAMNELTNIISSVDVLNQVVETNNTKIEEGNVRAQDVIVANEALAQACALFGLPKPTTFSFESTKEDPVGMLKAANEDIGDTISKGFDTVIKFFKNLFAGIWKFIKGLFIKEDKQLKELEELNVKVDNLNPTLDKLKYEEPKADTEEKVKYDKIGTNLATAAKLIGILTDSNLENSEEIVKYLTSLEHKVNELINVDTAEHLAMVEFNAKSIFLCLKASDSDTVEHTLEKINNTSSVVKPASTGIAKDLDTLYKGVNKNKFEQVFKYCSEVEVDDKNSTYSINQIFKTTNDSRKIIATEEFKVLVNNYKIVNGKIKAFSKMFGIETSLVKSEVVITDKDIEAALVKSKSDVLTVNAAIKKNIKVLRDYNVKVNKCIEDGTKKLEEVILELERDINHESIKNKLDINSVFTLIRNCSHSTVNTKNLLSTLITASLALGREFNHLLNFQIQLANIDKELKDPNHKAANDLNNFMNHHNNIIQQHTDHAIAQHHTM